MWKSTTYAKNIFSERFPPGLGRFWGKKWKVCPQLMSQKQRILSSTERVNHLRRLQHRLTTYRLRHHPPSHSLRQLHPPPPLPSLPPSATRKIPTSISSEEEITEGTTEVEVATEDSAVKAGQIRVDSPTRRQPEAAHKSRSLHPLSPDCVVGTAFSATKVANASLIVPVSNHSPLHNSRETAKGADDCEFGDPLFIIHNLEE